MDIKECSMMKIPRKLWIRQAFSLIAVTTYLFLVMLFQGCATSPNPLENELILTRLPSAQTVITKPIMSQSPTLPSNGEQKKIRASGEAILTANLEGDSNSLDLDSGKVVGNDSGNADISLRTNVGSMNMIFDVLYPLNGAKQFSTYHTEASFSECFQNLSNYSSSNIPDFGEDNALCFITNEGRLAAIRYVPNSYKRSDNNHEVSIRIKYIVWDQIIK